MMNLLFALISTVLGTLIVFLLIYWKLKGPVASLLQNFQDQLQSLSRNFDSKLGDLRIETELKYQTYLRQELTETKEELAGAIQTHVGCAIARLKEEVVSQLQQDLAETEEKLVAAVQIQVASEMAQLKKDLVARTRQRSGGLYNTDMLKPFVNISGSGQR